MEVRNNVNNETAKQMCLWLDGALQAERQLFALALEKRHCMLVKECMKQHSTMFVQAAGVPKGEAGEIQAKQQSIAEEREKQKADQLPVNGATEGEKQKADQPQGASSILLASTEPRQSTSSTQFVPSPKQKGSILDELRQVAPIQPTELQNPAQFCEPHSGESSEASGTMFSFLAGKVRSVLQKVRAPKRGSIFGENDTKGQYKGFLHGLVKHTRFEFFFVLLIVANTVVMALESQYAGFGIGLDVNYPNYNRTADKVWPGMKSMFRTLDLVFGIVFTIELFLKICGLRLEFFCDGWNLFDALIVLGWCVDAGASGTLPVDLMMFRLARLARLMRLLKVLKSLKGIDPLFLMITSLKGSMSILFWVFIFMLGVQTMSALLMNQLLVSFYLEEDNDAATKKEVFKYFGSFSRSMLSMFEITMGNWVPIGRLLLEGVSEWILLFTIIHKLTMGFAVLGVINGIFIQETFKVAACDDTLMMMQKDRAMKVHTQRMHQFFQVADTSKDGVLDQKEFRAVLHKGQIRAWLAAQGLDASDADNLYLLLDQGAQGLSAAELVQGVNRLKGPSRSIDLIMLMHKHRQLEEKMEEMQKNGSTTSQCRPGLAVNDQLVNDFLQVSSWQGPTVAGNLESNLDHADARFQSASI